MSQKKSIDNLLDNLHQTLSLSDLEKYGLSLSIIESMALDPLLEVGKKGEEYHAALVLNHLSREERSLRKKIQKTGSIMLPVWLCECNSHLFSSSSLFGLSGLFGLYGIFR